MASKFKTIPDLEFTRIVAESHSVAECFRRLGVTVSGGNYSAFHRKVDALKLLTSHFKGQGYLQGGTHSWSKKISLDEILNGNHPSYPTCKLKRRLKKEKGWEHKCHKCENTSWMGVDIPLEVDHINGISDDHRIENIRFLCCNCHALTETYRGKNRRVRLRSSTG